MADLNDVKKLIVEQGDQWSKWHSQANARLADLETRMNRPGAALHSAEVVGGGYSRELGTALRKAMQGDDRELKAMSASDDSAGGYMVIPAMDAAVRRIRDVVSPVSALCRNVTLDSGGEFLMPYTRGTLGGSWVGEADSRPEVTSVPVGEHRINLDEVYTMPVVTQKLLDVANYDVSALLIDQIGHGLAAAEASAVHIGNGVGRPRGFTTYTMAATADATRTWTQIEYIASGGSGAFASDAALDKLMDLEAALKPQYRANARWVMPRAAANLVRKLKASTAGSYLWEPSGQAGQPPTMLGYPVTISDDVPTVAANSYSIWFGDFQQGYTIVRMDGLRLLRDPYSDKGRVGFYAYQRVGGAVTNSEAIKAIKFASS